MQLSSVPPQDLGVSSRMRHREPLGALGQHLHGPVLRIAPQTEAEEVAVLGPGDGRLGLVHLEPQAPLDEPGQAGHHPPPRSLRT
jgi:hypothetical protein